MPTCRAVRSGLDLERVISVYRLKAGAVMIEGVRHYVMVINDDCIIN